MEAKITIENSPSQTDEPIRLKIVNNVECFRKLEKPWNALIHKTEGSLFMTHDWISGWWEFYGKHKYRHLHILVYYKGDRVVGIAPFYIAESAFMGYVIQRRLNLMGSGGSRSELVSYLFEDGFSDSTHLIIDSEYADTVEERLASYLLNHRRDFDTFHLYQVNDDSRSNRLIKRLGQHSIEYLKKKQTENLFIGTYNYSHDFETYLKSRSKQVRKRIRRTLRDHKSATHYTVRHCHSPEEMRRASAYLVQLHQKRWNGDGQPGKFSDPRFIKFHDYITERFIENKWLRVKAAEVNGAYVAVDVGVEFNGVLYSWLNAFDPDSEAARHSPGIGLLIEFIHESFQKKLRRIDLLRGTEEYKYKFTSESVTNWKYSVDLNDSIPALRSFIIRILPAQALIYKHLQWQYKSYLSRGNETYTGKAASYLKSRANSLHGDSN